MNGVAAIDASRPAAMRMPAALRVALATSGELDGGVERFVFLLAQALRETPGMEPEVILLSNGPLRARLREAGIPTTVITTGRRFEFRALSELRRVVAERRIGLIHSHGYKASVLSALLTRSVRVPWVKTDHGVAEPGPWPARVKMGGYYAVDRFLTTLWADRVAFVSPSLMAKSGGRRSRRTVIPNAHPDLRRDDTPSPPLRPLDAFHIGIVGRLAPVKGHAVLFEALFRARTGHRMRLHVFGTGPLEADLKERARWLGIADRVEFHGHCADMPSQLARLDAMIMPSLYEGFPYALLEAMFLEVPVLASRVGGLADVLTDRVHALLVEPGDAAALADAMDELGRNRRLRRRLAETARDLAHKNYRIETMRDRYVALYRELVPFRNGAGATDPRARAEAAYARADGRR